MNVTLIRRWMWSVSLVSTMAMPSMASAQEDRPREHSRQRGDARQTEARVQQEQPRESTRATPVDGRAEARRAPEVRRDSASVPAPAPAQTVVRRAPDVRGREIAPVPSVRPSAAGRYDAPRYVTNGAVYRTPAYVAGPRYVPHVVGYGAIRPWGAVRFYQPYYAFHPHFAIGVGLSIGYPVPYPYAWYDPFAYPAAYAAPVYRNAYGGVSFDLDPQDAGLYVDGAYIGTTSEFGPYQAPLTLPVGVHRVQILAPGYQALTFDISVISGQVIPYQGRMAWLR